MTSSSIESIDPATDNPTDWQVRPFADTDLAGIVALVNSVSEAYNLQETVSEAEMRIWLTGPRSDPPRQRVVVDGPRIMGVPHNMPVGYANIRYEDDEAADERSYYLNLHIHRAAEGLGLENRLAQSLLDMVRDHEADPNMPARSKVLLKASVPEPLRYKRDFWQRLGMREVRQFWAMARSLNDPIDEPTLVDGVDIRAFRYPEDSEAARTAFNNSFADHWDHHDVDQADWEHWMKQDIMRPDLSLLAEVDDRPGTFGGFCIISILPEDNKKRGVQEGWIDLLGTTRAWRRVGLGRALLLHGLHSLKVAGMETAMLGVDSTSPTGANKLYESVGFRIRLRDFAYEAKLDEVRL